MMTDLITLLAPDPCNHQPINDPDQARREHFDARSQDDYLLADSFIWSLANGNFAGAEELMVHFDYEPDLIAGFLTALRFTPTHQALRRYIDDLEHPMFGYFVACSPQADHDTSHILAHHPVQIVRLAVALNMSTPACVLAALSFDLSDEVAAAIASNAATPLHTLASLVHHPSHRVRSRAADQIEFRNSADFCPCLVT